MNDILAQIRRALGVSGIEPARRALVNTRLNNHPRNLVPACAQLPHDELVRVFIDNLEAVETSVAQIEEMRDVAHEIARYVIVNDLPDQIRCGSDPLLEELDWSEQSDLQILRGAANPSDALSLTHAFAGASETGTLFVSSGPENPVTLSFLPETNIVLIRARDIVGSYEDGFEKTLERGGGEMPRTLNLISGPSRTADIEQTLITGAHGPRRLHVIIVGQLQRRD